MKFAFVFDYNPFQLSSASALRYSSVIKELLNQGNKVDLFILGSNLDNTVDDSEASNVWYFSTFKTTSLFRRRLWSYGLKYLAIEVMIRKVSQHIAKEHYDIVWYSNSYAALRLLNYKKEKEAKHLLEITEFHDLHTNIIPDKNLIRSYFLNKEVELFQRSLKKLDVGLFITKTLCDYYSPYFSPNALLINFPMIVDPSRFVNLKKAESTLRVIRYMGSFSNKKDGIDVLIKAFGILAEEYKDVTLELAGGEHRDKSMQLQLIKNLELEERIKYVGLIDRTEIPTFLSSAFMLVLARPESKQAEGGFPTKLGEYLSSGVPVCCTRVGEIPDYLDNEKSIFFAKPGSEKSFANAMRRVLENPELSIKVAENGRHLANSAFSAKIQTKELICKIEKEIIKPKN